ncbi:hypothetical protein FYK55_27245 [Roseiconus nitratireducens]|uniref:Uncharacterized protein n=1 Tax=Roseiconus nitratireducens TaxID=2605748 RepID=A0A5M6CUG5_9BACT|nr:hypothetical protein [Roseiconus nitratireducens]KAA5538586.1 hypothetical protein FYK55_27245 [Roseiconus nitratireducens]
MNQIKNLLSKVWGKESADFTVGRHEIDEVIVVRVRGSVEKHADQFVSPTVSIPLVSTLALFWEKAGLNRDDALSLLREAITEAMDDKVNEDSAIQSRIDDVQEAISTVRKELIDRLPKMKRSGRLVTKDLDVAVTPVGFADEVAA